MTKTRLIKYTRICKILILLCVKSSYSYSLLAKFNECLRRPDIIADNEEISSCMLYGKPTTITEYPYFAALRGCAAGIISNTWALTAAHCVQGRGPQPIIYVGSDSIAKSTKYNIKRIVINEYYTLQPLPINDIALIEVAEPFDLSHKIQPVKLPTGPAPESVEYAFVSRGIEKGGRLANTLMVINAFRISHGACLKYMPHQIRSFFTHNMFTFERSVLCVKRADDKPGPCMGDSGNLLVRNGVAYGITSFLGSDECDIHRLSFFTNIISYVPWIKEVTNIP